MVVINLICPNCGEKDNFAIEKTLDGNVGCITCGHYAKYEKFKDKEAGINWFKSSEKMPEEGEEVVLLDKSLIIKGFCNDVLCDDDKWAKEVSYKKIGAARHISYIRIDFFEYWAYASDFNFPKSEE